MDAPSNPAAMQAHILERLAQNSNKKRKSSRVPEKFSKELAGLIDTRLKDRIFHEIDVHFQSVSEDTSHGHLAAGDENDPIAALHDDKGRAFAFVTANAGMMAMLGRLYFGQDLTAQPATGGRAPTASELGMLKIFAVEIAAALKRKAVVSVANVVSVLRSHVETDEISNDDLVVCRFSIEAGAMACSFSFAVRETIVKGTQTVDSVSTSLQGQSAASPDLSRTNVTAKIALITKPSTLHQMRDLRVGDCLPLASSDVLCGRLIIRDKEMCQGEIGRLGGNYSFKVTEVSGAEDQTAIHSSFSHFAEPLSE